MGKTDNVEDRLTDIEQQLRLLSKAFGRARTASKNAQKDKRDITHNKDGLPTNICLVGVSKGIPYLLTIDAEGRYVVGEEVYASLSAAAEAVSGVRRSGWTFWKMLNGRTLKEAFKG